MTPQETKDASGMTIEEIKQLVRRFIEVQNQMKLEALDQLVAPDMIDHSGRVSSREGAKQLLALFASAFPDWFAAIEDLIAEGDKAVMRGVASGMHRGVFMGIPPTGKRVTVPGIHIMRIADGKIVEHWGEGDFLGMMQQLGVLPGSTQTPPSVGGCTGHQKGALATSIHENKTLCARPHEEIFNQGKLAVADEIFSPEFAWYEAHLPPLPKGPESIKMFATMLRAAFPDLHLTVEDSIAEGDRVVNRWSFRGTQRGEFYGVPPTEREVTTSGIDIWRVEDGRIVENHQEVDNLGLLQQLGAIPQPEQVRA
jgi:steroid delta-isomerase-like uncharacterized protein